MKKPLYSGICFSFMAFVLVLFSGCGNISEDELLPAYTPSGSPYHFKAFYINASNDTTAKYNLALNVIALKSNIEGENGGYSISFNSGGENYKTSWKISSTDTLATPITLERDLSKTKTGLKLELPNSGPFAPLNHTLGLIGSKKDKKGKKAFTESKGFQKSADDYHTYKSTREVTKIEDQTWNNQTLKTWFYEASTMHGDLFIKEKYQFNPDFGFLRAEFEIPVDEQYSFGNEIAKIHLLQLPKTDPSQPN